MKFTKQLLVAGLIGTASIAYAEEPESANESAWSSTAELGTIFTSGNTDTTSINGSLTLEHDGQGWDSLFKLSALNTKEGDVTSNEKYNFFAQFNNDIGERSYIAIIADQERDRFSGYLYQTTISANYGYHAIQQDDMTLDIEVGPGYSRDKLLETSEIIKDAIGRLAINFNWTIRDGVEFIELFNVEGGDEQVVYKSETGLQSQIAGNLASKITYKIKHVDTVPEGVENTDSELGITLVYSF